MAEGILKFTLPDEEQGYMRAVLANDAFSALYDIQELLHQIQKYPSDQDYKEFHQKTVSKISSRIQEIFDENGINLNAQYS